MAAETSGTGAAVLTKDNYVLPTSQAASGETAYGVGKTETQLEAEGLLELNQRATGAYRGDGSYVAADAPTADGARTA